MLFMKSIGNKVEFIKKLLNKQNIKIDVEYLLFLLTNPVSYTHLDVYKRQAYTL